MHKLFRCLSLYTVQWWHVTFVLPYLLTNQIFAVTLWNTMLQNKQMLGKAPGQAASICRMVYLKRVTCYISNLGKEKWCKGKFVLGWRVREINWPNKFNKRLATVCLEGFSIQAEQMQLHTCGLNLLSRKISMSNPLIFDCSGGSIPTCSFKLFQVSSQHCWFGISAVSYYSEWLP